MQIKILNELTIGEKGLIYKINSNHSIRRRLQELGFIENNIVECYLISPLGEPIAYKINNTIIALRSEEAVSILIKIKSK